MFASARNTGWLRPTMGWARLCARGVGVLLGFHAILHLVLAASGTGPILFYLPAALALAGIAVLAWTQHPAAPLAYLALWIVTLVQTFLLSGDVASRLLVGVVLPTLFMLMILALRTVPRRRRRYVVPVIF